MNRRCCGALRGGGDLGRLPAPDETPVLRFRHLLEEHELCGRILNAVNLYLAGKGIRIGTGTIVDATIIQAASSATNASGERDPEMHQTRKGNQWCVSRTRAKARGAVPKMGVGLPESACRRRLQIASCCCVEKAW